MDNFDTDPKEFEKQVLRVARVIWPAADISGAIVMENRERDGIFITDDAIHIIECTTSRKKNKAENDFEKSVDLGRTLRKSHPNKAIHCWFITQDEPTADQLTVANKIREFTTHAVSYGRFRSRLINIDDYLELRWNYAFGSARNLANNSHKISQNAYVPLDLLRIHDSSNWSVDKIVARILEGRGGRIAIYGDYGSGKSMTLRQIYFRLTQAYNKNVTDRFPVYINLSDHGGQSHPEEVLERHARKIAFSPPYHLVRAWQSGYITLILDGFDELSSTGWQQFNGRLRDVRYKSMEGVRRLVSQAAPESAVIISGRESYFDTTEECRKAIGFLGKDVLEFTLNEFTEDQIREYIKKLGSEARIPDWLPSKPLLIGFMLQRGALTDVSIPELNEVGRGWDFLLDRICERETDLPDGIDSNAIRRILERLSTIARMKGGVLAPLNDGDLLRAFKSAIGRVPDQSAETLLMRLPGLGQTEGKEERKFVDREYASACAAGSLADFVEHEFSTDEVNVADVQEVISSTGARVAYEIMERKVIASRRIVSAVERAIEKVSTRKGSSMEFPVDLIKVLLHGEFSKADRRPSGRIADAMIDEIDFTEVEIDLSEITFERCIIINGYFSEDSNRDDFVPHFRDCDISYIDGRNSEHDLPLSRFLSCRFGQFIQSRNSGSGVLGADTLPAGVAILVECLNRLFVQKGGGRKENAFFRGSSMSDPTKVRKVLDLIKNAGYASPSRRRSGDIVWTPNRRLAAVVQSIIVAPHTTREAIVLAAREIR